MNCEQALQLSEAYLDGELELTRCLEVEQHVAGCADCMRRHSNLRLLGAQIRIEAPRHTAPAHLRDRLTRELKIPAPPPSARVSAAPAIPARAIKPMAAVVCSALLGALIWTAIARHQDQHETIESAVVAHVRSLHANSLADVASTNQHTVKPWLTSKLDFAASVVDLSSDGFELVGGRVDHVAHQTVAAVVYRRREHVINVFMWPAKGADAAAPALQVERGFNVFSWTAQGMNGAAVSDLNRDELQGLAQRLASAGNPAAPR
jgi:anti-sigma factor RsiW